jgi:hypothetical protein
MGLQCVARELKFMLWKYKRKMDRINLGPHPRQKTGDTWIPVVHFPHNLLLQMLTVRW